MKHWMYAEPAGLSSHAVWRIYSKAAIIAEYWDHWKIKMRQHNLCRGLESSEYITEENCIEDWITIHWAIPATIDKLAEILAAPNPQ